MVKKIQVNLSNKLFYSLVAVAAIVVLGVGVYAIAGVSHDTSELPAETDPTITDIRIKDGVSWTEISGIPITSLTRDTKTYIRSTCFAGDTQLMHRDVARTCTGTSATYICDPEYSTICTCPGATSCTTGESPWMDPLTFSIGITCPYLNAVLPYGYCSTTTSTCLPASVSLCEANY